MSLRRNARCISIMSRGEPATDGPGQTDANLGITIRTLTRQPLIGSILVASLAEGVNLLLVAISEYLLVD